MQEYIIPTINQLDEIARKIVPLLKSSPVAAFYGQMGSGKTTIIKAICNCLGVKEVVTSPTFSIINEYTTTKKNKVYHFDFYRLKTIAEAENIGFGEYIFSGEICLIEWPELINEILPENTLKIYISVNDNQERILTIP